MIAYMEIDSINGTIVDIVPPTPEKGYSYDFSYEEEKWIKREINNKNDEVRVYTVKPKKLFH